MDKLRRAIEADLGDIQALYNEAIRNSTAVYEYDEFSSDYMLGWWRQKQEGGWPVLIMEVNGVFAGFATYGKFRERMAYASCVEHSLYVHPDFRGRGLGKKMIAELIQIAQNEGKHSLIGGIDAANEASILMHLKMGFVEVGRLPEVAFKFERWLDLVFVQYIIR